MNGLAIITSLAVGFVVGILAETIIGADQVRKLNAQIDRLKLENQALIDSKTEVIEIVDNRKEDSVDYFKPF